jgi:hypothetical protein
MDAKHILAGAALLGATAGFVWSAMPPAVHQSPEERARIEGSVTYGGCNEVRALGKAPLRAGEPGYRETMDGDGDGIACEPHPSM